MNRINFNTYKTIAPPKDEVLDLPATEVRSSTGISTMALMWSYFTLPFRVIWAFLLFSLVFASLINKLIIICFVLVFVYLIFSAIQVDLNFDTSKLSNFTHF